jgi:hypothetical protein
MNCSRLVRKLEVWEKAMRRSSKREKEVYERVIRTIEFRIDNVPTYLQTH